MKTKIWGMSLGIVIAAMALLVLQFRTGSAAPKMLRFHINEAQAVDTYATNCQSPTQTYIVNPDGGAAPYSPLSGRRSVTVCADPRNDLLLLPDAGAFRDGNRTPYATCTIDGTTPTLGGAGTVLGSGDCFGAALNYQQPVKCVVDYFDAGILLTECK